MERVIRGPEQAATIAIEDVRPDVDCGRYAVKRIVGDDVVVTADVFTHGHTELAVQLEYRHQTGRAWKSVPMRLLVIDRWTGLFPVERLGEYRFRIVAWPDELATWRRDFAKKLAAGVDTELDREEGALLAEQQAKRAGARDRAALETWIERLRGDLDRKAAENLDRLVTTARRAADPALATVFDATSPIWVDRPLARSSTWYELFPRSASPDPERPGTLADVIDRLVERLA